MIQPCHESWVAPSYVVIYFTPVNQERCTQQLRVRVYLFRFNRLRNHCDHIPVSFFLLLRFLYLLASHQTDHQFVVLGDEYFVSVVCLRVQTRKKPRCNSGSVLECNKLNSSGTVVLRSTIYIKLSYYSFLAITILYQYIYIFVFNLTNQFVLLSLVWDYLKFDKTSAMENMVCILV